MNPPGFFITLEGGEGSGKSTQMQRLTEAFTRAKLPHVLTREPGGTQAAESIRALLLAPREEPWDAMTETVLFSAARVDHARKKIQPALRAGTHVLCDRFADSTLAYQGIAGEMGEEFIRLMHHFTLGNLQPNLTFILDIAPEEGLKRAAARRDQHTRFEEKDMTFHQRIRQAFLSIAAREQQRCVVIDAAQAPDTVQGQMLEALRTRLGLSL